MTETWPPLSGEAILSGAREWIGVPFHVGGRSREGGVDCYRLWLCVLRDLGVNAPDRPGAAMIDPYAAMMGCLEAHTEPVTSGEPPLPGDAIVFRGRLMPCHLGIATGGGGFVHAHSGARRVTEQPLAEHWTERIVAVRRYRGAI